MAKQLLPLCSVGRITNRDGGVGSEGGRIWLPFFGYWFPDGKQIGVDNVAGNIPQDESLTMTGQVKPNIFTKSCCTVGCGDDTDLM